MIRTIHLHLQCNMVNTHKNTYACVSDTAHNMTRSCEQQVEVQASTEVAAVNNNLSSFALSIPVGVPENIWKTI